MVISKRNRNIFWLALVAVFIAAASIYSLVSSYASEVRSHRIVLLERGQTVLDALKAGILAHGRMGQYRGDRLKVIFEELARNPSILALELRGPDGMPLASGGQCEEISDAPQQRPRWEGNRLVLASHVDLLAECGHSSDGQRLHGQEDMEDWVPFSKGFYALTATLDATEVHQAIKRHRIQLAIATGVVTLALGLGTLAVILLIKRAELAAALARERERAQRQEQVALLGAGLAHETKNPLGIVRGLAQSIGDCTNHRCAIKDRAKDIVDEVDRVIGGINSFLLLARPQEAVPVCVHLDPFFKSFLPLLQMDSSAAEVGTLYVPCGLSVLADEDLLRRALLNLILNALRASKPGQSVRVFTKQVDSTVSLGVSDAGCGIAAEDLPRVTEPYFTRFSGGSGLGLSIVDQIAVAHGWRLRIESRLGQGTEAILEGISIVGKP
ncbi:MAG TPA: ATP-binding protein [Candidatus Hydrogenedentes bacterium]|nr:ATP-binding protein [Candidatus Hydrogenedentota bacterium]